MPEFDTRVSVQLTQDDYDALLTIAETEDRSVAYVIRKAIAAYLESVSGEGQPSD